MEETPDVDQRSPNGRISVDMDEVVDDVSGAAAGDSMNER